MTAIKYAICIEIECIWNMCEKKQLRCIQRIKNMLTCKNWLDCRKLDWHICGWSIIIFYPEIWQLYNFTWNLSETLPRLKIIHLWKVQLPNHLNLFIEQSLNRTHTKKRYKFQSKIRHLTINQVSDKFFMYSVLRPTLHPFCVFFVCIGKNWQAKYIYKILRWW